MRYITVLNFSNGSVDQHNLKHVENIKEWRHKDFENFLIYKGYELKKIHWMSHDNDYVKIVSWQANLIN